MSESGEHLTTSRVSRLLRPLRNKCNTLAALPKATISHVTYLKHSSTWDPRSRPLSVLCPPTGTKKLMLDRRSTDEYELSRRIYAVCDAFKNVAYIAYGRIHSERIPSLAAMCSLVIGENLPAANHDGISADSGGGPADETDVVDIDCVYETVPPHYRRFLIVSHALSMVLSICTHHHTLTTILLDHCLSFGLVHESTLLLHTILAQALLPSNPSYPPLVTHPGHVNYLLDLHAKWTTGNKPSVTSPGFSLFTTSTFCQAVLGCLSQSSLSNASLLWTSKVLNRLLHAVGSSDVDSYMAVIRALSLDFRETFNSLSDVTGDSSEFTALRSKLSELMSNLFDMLFSQCDSPCYAPTSSRIYAVIDILHHCHHAQLHRSRTNPRSIPIDLPDIIIVFATHILVAFRNSIDDPNRLLLILNDSHPIPQTFYKLITHLARPQETQTCEGFFEAFFSELQSYSSVLCSAELFTLEASLWACALRYFETSIANSQRGDPVLVTRYRQRLMEAVDTAERRCFGGDTRPVIPLSNHSNHAGPDPKTNQRWRWECAVDSWIRQTPMHKKRKIGDGLPHTPLQAARSRIWGVKAVLPTSTSVQVSTRHRRSSSFSQTSSSSSFSDTEYFPEDGSEPQDETNKENYRSNPPLERPNWRRLSSVLADAQKRRIVLHSKPCQQPKPPSPVIPENYLLSRSSQDFRVPRKQAISRKVSLAPAQSGISLPSDDSLNLFAYPTSSPPRSRC